MLVIHVTVALDGAARVETHGFAGQACQSASRSLETALGLVQSEALTADYFQPTHQESPLAARDAPAS